MNYIYLKQFGLMKCLGIKCCRVPVIVHFANKLNLVLFLDLMRCFQKKILLHCRQYQYAITYDLFMVFHEDSSFCRS